MEAFFIIIYNELFFITTQPELLIVLQWVP